MASKQFYYKNSNLFCEGVSLDKISKTFGTPTYVYSKSSLINSFIDFDSAFKNISHLTCYSVKANSNQSIIKILYNAGAGIDVNSGGEFFKSIRAGVNPKKIIYTGVGKTNEEIEMVLKSPILMVKIESIEELKVVNEIAKKLKTVVPIGIRINPNIDAKTHPYISTGLKENKFGISISESIAAFKFAKTLKNLKIVGVDTHIGSQILNAAPFAEAAKSLVGLVKQLSKIGIRIEHLDLGGGLGIDYKTHLPKVTPKQLSAKLIPILKQVDCKIIFEPGRFLTANAGLLLTKTLFTKKNSKKNFAIVDAGMNDFLRPAFYNAFHEILPVRKNKNNYFKVDVVGPVCESGDFFAKNRMLQKINRNDLLAILSSGAYGFVMSSNYNSRLRAAEILVDGDKFYEIRKRESFNNLIENEKLIFSD